jgi:hypothetical protein
VVPPGFVLRSGSSCGGQSPIEENRGRSWWATSLPTPSPVSSEKWGWMPSHTRALISSFVISAQLVYAEHGDDRPGQ